MAEDKPTLGQIAMSIVNQGGSILLPWAAGDAPVKFDSRRRLYQLILEALEKVAKGE